MTTETTLKQTPLYDTHLKYGGKVIDFGGWALPVQYSGIIEEHEAVRNNAGLFDVSHMGEVMVEGKDAESYINYLVSNDVTKVKINQAQYSVLCYPDGGAVDDLLVYKLAEEKYLVVVNASNTDKDFAWMQEHLKGTAGAAGILPGVLFSLYKNGSDSFKDLVMGLFTASMLGLCHCQSFLYFRSGWRMSSRSRFSNGNGCRNHRGIKRRNTTTSSKCNSNCYEITIRLSV